MYNKELKSAFTLDFPSGESVYVEIIANGNMEVWGETGEHLFTIHRRDRDVVSMIVEVCQTLHSNKESA